MEQELGHTIYAICRTPGVCRSQIDLLKTLQACYGSPPSYKYSVLITSSLPPFVFPDCQVQTSRSVQIDIELLIKTHEACRVAREAGYRHLWIDSCCINETSSTESSEANNLTGRWYDGANAYNSLSNIPPDGGHRPEGSAFC